MIDVLVSVVSEKDNMCLSYRWLDGSGYFLLLIFAANLCPKNILHVILRLSDMRQSCFDLIVSPHSICVFLNRPIRCHYQKHGNEKSQ